jgi:hypothetical protein
MAPGAHHGDHAPHLDDCAHWWPEGGECTCPDSVLYPWLVELREMVDDLTEGGAR